MAAATATGRRRQGDAGQGVVEAVLCSFLLAAVLMGGADLAKYVFARSSANAACTEVARTLQADWLAGPDDLEAAAEAAAANLGNVDVEVVRGPVREAEYVYRFPDGNGSWTEKPAKSASSECTATVRLECTYLTGLGKALGLFAGTGGSYTVEASRTFSVDRTGELGSVG